MMHFYERYQQDFHLEVYDELLAMGEQLFVSPVYEDARLVAQALMKRVRYNLEEILIPRLRQIGYRFGEGAWDHTDYVSEQELLAIQREEPIFQAPTSKTSILLADLERRKGPLPLSLKCWYEEVGAVNLIGTFPTLQVQKIGKEVYKRGYGLDPLHTQPLIDVVEELADFGDEDNGGDEQEPISVPISPDGDFKYGYSGGGDYEIAIPCNAFDGVLLGEEHDLTFVNYLRLCFRWGGFPGLEKNGRLAQAELEFLTNGLLPF